MQPMSAAAQKKIVVYSHSMLFYWWPVWVAGFIMALVSYLSDQRLAIVPAGTVAKRDALVAPEGKTLPVDKASQELIQPHLRISSDKNLGVLYCMILLLVIFTTNVPLRGLWSVIAILVILFLSILFAVAHIGDRTIWDIVIANLTLLDIRMNMGGYLFVSLVLFVIWCIVFFFFDKHVYGEFTPGGFSVVQDIGAGVKAFPAFGMVVTKQRSDLFRHIILGFGSGDLLIQPQGGKPIELPNVLFAGRRDKEINEVMKQHIVVPAGAQG
jgi:hypothetical protein